MQKICGQYSIKACRKSIKPMILTGQRECHNKIVWRSSALGIWPYSKKGDFNETTARPEKQGKSPEKIFAPLILGSGVCKKIFAVKKAARKLFIALSPADSQTIPPKRILIGRRSQLSFNFVIVPCFWQARSLFFKKEWINVHRKVESV